MSLTFGQSKNYGPSGYAEVRLLKSMVRILFEDGDMYELPLDKWPKERKAGHYIVGLNKDRTEISFLKPPKGDYIVRIKQFQRGQGAELPEPYIERGGPRTVKSTGKSWYAPDEMRFRVMLELVGNDSQYDGLTVSHWLPYIFQQKAGTNEVSAIGRKGQVESLERFLRIAGFDFMNDTLQYTPNVLPQLEHILLEKGEVFKITLTERGFVGEMSSIPASLLPPSLKKAKKKEAA